MAGTSGTPQYQHRQDNQVVRRRPLAVEAIVAAEEMRQQLQLRLQAQQAAEAITVVEEMHQQLQLQAAVEMIRSRLLLPITRGGALHLQPLPPELPIQIMQADLRLNKIQETKLKIREAKLPQTTTLTQDRNTIADLRLNKMQEVKLKIREAKLLQTTTPIQDRNTIVRTETEHIRQVIVIR